ncbi:thioesterase [Melanogaster broomeanus]|nr:thioesterase [Melanogaster broomeanus]
MSSSSALNNKKQRRRSDYPFFLSYRTRWSDNDQYAHVNNAVYYHLFDAVVNAYLIDYCQMDPTKSDQIGLVVSSFCEYFSALSFPDVLDLGLRVTNLGKSSVTYEVGVFKARISDTASEVPENQGLGFLKSDAPAAVGGYTHVFVDSTSRKSAPMSDRMRGGLLELMTQTVSGKASKL